jgi:hypothetical protein
MESIDLRLEPGAPALPGGKKTEEMKFIMNRTFECLGSTINDQVFMIVEEDINDAKGKVSPQVHIFSLIFSLNAFFFLYSICFPLLVPFLAIP